MVTIFPHVKMCALTCVAWIDPTIYLRTSDAQYTFTHFLHYILAILLNALNIIAFRHERIDLNPKPNNYSKKNTYWNHMHRRLSTRTFCGGWLLLIQIRYPKIYFWFFNFTFNKNHFHINKNVVWNLLCVCFL